MEVSEFSRLYQPQAVLKLCFCLDGNCIHMVDTGIVQKLLELLDRHVEEGNVTVQHAALSALRNLAIPGELFGHPEVWSNFKCRVWFYLF